MSICESVFVSVCESVYGREREGAGREKEINYVKCVFASTCLCV